MCYGYIKKKDTIRLYCLLEILSNMNNQVIYKINKKLETRVRIRNHRIP